MDSLPWMSLFFYFNIIFLFFTTFIFFMKTFNKKELKKGKIFINKYWVKW